MDIPERFVTILPRDLVANGVDTDQMLQNVASDLGLQCLLRSVCPDT